MRPLDGVMVLDFTTLLPGPLATLLLVEAGAEVIKVERPGGGDEMRGFEPRVDGEGALFALLNRGKDRLTLDLKDAADRARLEPLLARCDVLVEQFRPGVMARLGLDHAGLSARHPGIITCSITGYGQTGPRALEAGHDLNYVAASGLLSLPPDGPTVPPALIADIAGGAYPAVMNILLALRERDRTGRGRHLDIAMADNVWPFLFEGLARGFATGRWPGPGDCLLTGGSPRYRVYRTADGRHLAAAPLEDRFWAEFCRVLAVPLDAGVDAVQARIGQESAAVWAERFTGVDACVCVVATLEEAVAGAHVRARGLLAGHVAVGGATIPALPLPLVAAYRAPEG